MREKRRARVNLLQQYGGVGLIGRLDILRVAGNSKGGEFLAKLAKLAPVANASRLASSWYLEKTSICHQVNGVLF